MTQAAEGGEKECVDTQMLNMTIFGWPTHVFTCKHMLTCCGTYWLQLYGFTQFILGYKLAFEVSWNNIQLEYAKHEAASHDHALLVYCMYLIHQSNWTMPWLVFCQQSAGMLWWIHCEVQTTVSIERELALMNTFALYHLNEVGCQQQDTSLQEKCVSKYTDALGAMSQAASIATGGLSAVGTLHLATWK